MSNLTEIDRTIPNYNDAPRHTAIVIGPALSLLLACS